MADAAQSNRLSYGEGEVVLFPKTRLCGIGIDCHRLAFSLGQAGRFPVFLGEFFLSSLAWLRPGCGRIELETQRDLTFWPESQSLCRHVSAFHPRVVAFRVFQPVYAELALPVQSARRTVGIWLTCFRSFLCRHSRGSFDGGIVAVNSVAGRF